MRADTRDGADRTPPGPPSLRSLAWAVLLVAALGAAALVVGDVDRVMAALARLPIAALVAALGFALLNYALRFARWSHYLARLGYRLPWSADAVAYVAGFAFTATPGKAGEATRALFLKPLGVRYGHTIGTCVSERLLDLASIVAIAALGLLLYASYLWVVAVATALLVSGWVLAVHRDGLSALFDWGQRRLGQRIANLLARGQHTVDVMPQLLSGRLAVAGFIAGTTGWLAEATGFWILAGALGAALSWPQAAAIYALSLLAGALSFLPGGLVGTEIVMVALMAAAGASQESAMATTLVARACTLWFSIALGVSAVGLLRWRGAPAPAR